MAGIALISPPPCEAQATSLNVTATILPFGDIAKRVGGDAVNVTVMLKPGQSPHTYEPTPGDLKSLGKADLVVMAGFGLESWLSKLLKTSGRQTLYVDCSKVVKNPISSEEEGHHEGEEDHHHGAVNPHYWLDPSIMADVARHIGVKLAEKMPSRKKEFISQAEVVANELLNLDKEIEKKLSDKNLTRGFVSFHNAWPYFARRYGLKVAGVIEMAPGREPSAKHMTRLVKEIKQKGVKAVMVEPQFPTRLGEVLAEEAGVKVVAVDPEGGSRKTGGYIELMRFNAAMFEKALR
ncbi:MAG: zinc ABC transporter substrate-binding protein [Nitrospinae bacterium]|nr:zinc ABC transporter substrate-binding protein [Nitrospinota bacterium]